MKNGRTSRMRYIGIAVFILMLGICPALYAEEAEETKETEKAKEVETKGLEMVPETVMAVVNKADALLTGNLKCTMTIDKDKYRDDYTFDPQGRRIPRATLGRYDSGVR